MTDEELALGLMRAYNSSSVTEFQGSLHQRTWLDVARAARAMLTPALPVFTHDDHTTASRAWYADINSRAGGHWWAEVVGKFYEEAASRRLAEAGSQGVDLDAMQDRGEIIILSAAERQSRHSRVRWAEGLIKRLLVLHNGKHDGASSWLLNYGSKNEPSPPLAPAAREESPGDGERDAGTCPRSVAAGESPAPASRKRVAVQIAAIPSQLGTHPSCLYALDNDGSIWFNEGDGWGCYGNLPDLEPEVP